MVLWFGTSCLDREDIMAVDRIQLLTEAVCNLVRAQEVVSNPAAAVKELIDNAIDAGATSIQLDIASGGKIYIHIVDNGCGMSAVDARMAFERHATSKIRSIEDLEKIETLGFRGEGLASIAAVSKVELRTRREEDELATEVVMAGGEFIKTASVVAPVGTSIKMSDIFYNVPGRRRSLKKDQKEEDLIDMEFVQSALVHPHIAYKYSKSGKLFKELRVSSLKERIIALAGRSLGEKLLPLNYDSPDLKISGFISSPDGAVKTRYKQYFFVNGRYIKHDYFRKAIEQAFEPLIPVGAHPQFFIYFTVPADHVDINIHPSKKEVRFIDEPFIYQIISSLILPTLTSFPVLDFDNERVLEIPSYSEPSVAGSSVQVEDSMVKRVFMGGIDINRGFFSRPASAKVVQSDTIDWDTLTEGFSKQEDSFSDNMHTNQSLADKSSAFDSLVPLQHGFFYGDDFPTTGHLIYKGKYIISTLRRSLALVDFHRAHLRVLYGKYMEELKSRSIEIQSLMFPEQIDFALEDLSLVKSLFMSLREYGIEVDEVGEDGHYHIKAVPVAVVSTPVNFIHYLVGVYKELEEFDEHTLLEKLALYFADLRAYAYGLKLEPYDIDDLLANLFASENPNFDPYNRRIISLIEESDIDSRFN